MNAGLFLLIVGAIGASYAILILRGWQRRDSLVFGLLALTDAAMSAWRGVNILTGGSITSMEVMGPCMLGTLVLAVLTLEFLSAFPRRPAIRWPWRLAIAGWGAIGLAVIAVSVPFSDPSNLIADVTFFVPTGLIVLVLGVRARPYAHHRAERVVIWVLWFRWASGLVAYTIAPLVGVFEQMLWIDATIATLISSVVLGTAVLRGELFSVRSTASEVFTIATLVVLVMLCGGGAVTAALYYMEPGSSQRIALYGAALVPLAIAALGYAMYPRVERRVLAGLDERRARRLALQGEPLAADPDAAITEACRRIASIGDGAAVRWIAARDLPPELVAVLGDGEPLRGDERPLPACLIVPAMGADRALVGAFYLDHGTVDRDTYVVARDLAARVALAVQRAQAVLELHDARRLAALGQFAAAIAHDIRTPLTSISLNVQILRRKLQLSDDDREHLDIALEELARLDRSVAEILEFAKPVKLTSEPIDVGELIELTTKNLIPVLDERGVAVRITAGDPLTVHGDPLRLRQVLTNLVDNAANASQRGAEVTLRATATDDRRVAIEVEDRGRGIGPDDLLRIFEPFFTTRPDGTGLGLAIVHKVVRAHGGDITVRSTLGAGSTFTITLPGTLPGTIPGTPGNAPLVA